MKNSFILFLYFISVVICSKSYAVNSTNNDIEISGPAKVCLITPITYSIVKPKSGIIYKWKVIGGIIQGSDNTNELVVVFLSKETSYAVKITSYKKANPNLIIASKTLSITKIQPTISILGKDEAISSSYENYKCGYLDGDDYLWSIYPAEAGSIVEGNTTNNIKILWHNYTKGIPYIRLKVRKCNTLYYADYPVTLLFPPEITIEVPDSITINRKNIFTINLNSRINTIKQIDWDFGDGTTLSVTPDINGNFALSTDHTYTISDLYDITAVIYGANGCLYPSTAIQNILVLPSKEQLTPPKTDHVDLKYKINFDNNPIKYEVTLIDFSIFSKAYPIEKREFYIDGEWVDNKMLKNYSAYLLPGKHTFGIRVSGNDFSLPEKFITIDLPNFPKATFAYQVNPKNKNEFLFRATDTQEGNIYVWNFGDTSENNQQNPYKIFEIYNNETMYKAITLTVTNRLGYGTTYTSRDIIIKGSLISGVIALNPNNGKVSKNENITLTFILNNNGKKPLLYEWYINNKLEATTTTASFEPTKSGNYWLKVIDENGFVSPIYDGKNVILMP